MTVASLVAFGGACLVLGVQLGRWSVFLLVRRSWRAQQLRQLADVGDGNRVTRPYPQVQVEHAGQYVQHLGARAFGGQRWDPPDWFTR